MRKRDVKLLALGLAIVGSMAVILWVGSNRAAVTASGLVATPERVIVIDAGHGGEDGGAVAQDGTVESGINLAVAQRLRDLLCLLGEETEMTRTEDISIHSSNAKTLHEKKVSDLKNRVTLVNGIPHALLVSIHQNCLPSSPKVHGAQVFYNTQDGAQSLAQTMQTMLNGTINKGSPKESKLISPTIYLTRHVTAPTLLIECGFLSNPEETQHLQQGTYQTKLAAAIAVGLLAADEPV